MVKKEDASQKGLTPAMTQWFELKKENPDALLFFRMGDFYELFFEDATVASSALDIVLTGRGRYEGKIIPMCGVPFATAPAYLAKLVRRGFRVAIAEQTQSPQERKNAGKGPLKRHVVRLVTPGTLTEEELLDPTRSNFLLALSVKALTSKKKKEKATIGAAWIDVSTGYFATQNIGPSGVLSLIAKLDPAEILVDKDISLEGYDERKTVFPVQSQGEDILRALADIFDVSDLSAFGTFTPAELFAAFMVSRYVQHTQAGELPRLLPPSSLDKVGSLHLDPSTRASLDIVTTRQGEKAHTLFDAVDYTVSACGARLLSSWLSSPLVATSGIRARQEAWLWLGEHAQHRDLLQDLLRKNPDMMRALGRISFQRDLKRSFITLALGLRVAHQIYDKFSPDKADLPPMLKETLKHLATAYDLREVLDAALIFDPQEKEKIIASEFDEELAQYRELKDNSQRFAALLQEKYRKEFAISGLKIRHHAQMGYVLEVPVAHEQNLRANFPALFFRKGTKNAARFATQELVDLNLKITQAQEDAERREKEIVQQLIQKVLGQDELPMAAQSLAIMDVLQSCATLAEKTGWSCPEVTQDKRFELKACRHPVVEAALPSGSVFVPNDCDLTQSNRMMLLTGPNMAGKSTYLRQVALMIVLAQAGLPVSAEKAEIGIVDQLFSRVGAADDLVRGQSTFMVEMTETAAILNQAGPRSFVVVDEIGRGTATFDGLAIAQAVLETLDKTIGCRGIFATHFHELAKASQKLPHVCLFTMAVREWEGKIIFLHEVIEGEAKKSWGVHVAQLAGIPKNVVHRASSLVKELEDKEQGRAHEPLPLFETVEEEKIDNSTDQEKEITRELLGLDLNDMTPKGALDTLYSLQKQLKGE